MANLTPNGAAFDATQVAPDQGRPEPVPEGEYPMIVEASEMKPTKNQTGSYLEIVMQIIDGKHKGRKVWERFNLQNPNQKAVQIAYGQLSALCHAVNVLQPRDSAELHNIPFLGKVKYVPAEGRFDAKNEMRSYNKLAAPAAPTQAPAPAPAPQATLVPRETTQQAPEAPQHEPAQQTDSPWVQPPVEQPAQAAPDGPGPAPWQQ